MTPQNWREYKDRFLIFCARLLKEKLKFVNQLFCEYKELFYFLNSSLLIYFLFQIENRDSPLSISFNKDEI